MLFCLAGFMQVTELTPNVVLSAFLAAEVVKTRGGILTGFC